MTTLKDGSSANLGEILVGVVLRTGLKDKTVRRGGRAQAVRCLFSCVSSPEIQARERKREKGGGGSGRRREKNAKYCFEKFTFCSVEKVVVLAGIRTWTHRSI